MLREAKNYGKFARCNKARQHRSKPVFWRFIKIELARK